MNESSDEVCDAIEQGDVDRIDALIADGLAVNTCFGTDKWNLLHLALVSLTAIPDPKIVKHLIDLGVDVNARDWRLWTPLHFAVRTESSEVVRMLIDAGAEVDLPNDEGITPLHLGLVKRPCNLEIIEVLLAAGANPYKDHGKGTVVKYVNAISAPDIGAVVKLFDRYGPV